MKITVEKDTKRSAQIRPIEVQRRKQARLHFKTELLLLLLLYDMYVSCHRHFFLVLLLNQR